MTTPHAAEPTPVECRCPGCGRAYGADFRPHLDACAYPSGAGLAEAWWPPEVAAIYLDALAEAGGDDDALNYGPGHIAWADGNFTDDDIVFCLGECESRRAEWLARFGERAATAAKRSLGRLLAIPESDRGDDPTCD